MIPSNAPNGTVSPSSLVFALSGESRTSPLAFLHMIERLKTTPRTGWVNRDIIKPESIADHMYRMSVISMLCPDPAINRDKCVKMAIVHDMAEAIVGDITPSDPISSIEKHKMERNAMQFMMDDLLQTSCPNAAKEIMTLWQEYEDGSSIDAKFVKDVDKFELLMQIVEYECSHKGDKCFQDFIDGLKEFQTPCIREWATELMHERARVWENLTAKTQQS